LKTGILAMNLNLYSPFLVYKFLSSVTLITPIVFLDLNFAQNQHFKDDMFGIFKKKTRSIMKEVTVKELAELKASGADFQLIDVREPYEAEIAEMGGELIPMGTVMNNLDKISRDKQVIVHCRSGARSGNVVQALEAQQGFTNLYNLKGGILAWADEIDNSVQKY